MSLNTARRDRAIVRRRQEGAGLRTIADEFQLAARTVEAIVARDALARSGPDEMLSEAAYSALVEAWNDRIRTDRQAAARQCQEQGHEYRTTPFAADLKVCRRCLNYAHTERKAA